MELRAYQREAVEAVYAHLRARDDNPCAVIPTGGGKTPVMAAICRDAVQMWDGQVLILAHVKELLEQIAEKLRTMAPDLPFGIYSAGLKRRDLGYAVTIAGIQSVYQRACDIGPVDLAIVDECFPAGTMVSTPRGDTPIEDLCVGQPVHTALGVGEVEVISGRTAHRFIELELEDGKTIRCTPNHPFFTEQGWQEAQTLEVGSRLFGRQDVQALRSGDAAESLSRLRRASEVLHVRGGMGRAGVLLAEMRSPETAQASDATSSPTVAVEIERTSRSQEDVRMLRAGLSALGQDGRKRRDGQPYGREAMEEAALLLHLLRQEGGEPHVDAEDQREGSPDPETNWAFPTRAGRQRKADRTTDGIAQQAGVRLASGVYGPHPSVLLQWNAEEPETRHRQPGHDDRHRAGRTIPSHDQRSRQGQKKDGVLASHRVARIAHIQCESPVPVFNLQVAGHPSYYADGVLVHNCHLIPEDGEGMYRQFLADAKVINPQMRVIGLTATPFRMKSGMICAPENILNAICYEIGVRELIVQGYLCPLRTKSGSQRPDYDQLHVRGGEFIANEVEDLMDDDALVRSACREIVEHAADRKSVLIFASGVRHGEHIVRVLQERHSAECGFVCGETLPFERAQTLRRFRDGSLKYLCNVNVLTTGFDAPNIDCIALVRPTLSPGLYYQMVGRGFRQNPGKADCLVLDFGGNVLRHGPVDQIRIEAPREGQGHTPAKECPQCHEVIAAGYGMCPQCGYEFPPPERAKHDAEASSESILSDPASRTEHEVASVFYAIHTKRDAPPDAPRTMRVDYRIGFNRYVSEWICFEHTGYARQKAESWWRARSVESVPSDAAEAVELAHAGALARTLAVTVEHKPGEKYDRIVSHRLGDKPPRVESEEGLPEYAGIDEQDVPF